MGHVPRHISVVCHCLSVSLNISVLQTKNQQKFSTTNNKPYVYSNRISNILNLLINQYIHSMLAALTNNTKLMHAELK